MDPCIHTLINCVNRGTLINLLDDDIKSLSLWRYYSYIRQMVESFHTMIPSSVDPLLLSTHRQLNQSSEVAFTFVSAALHSKLRLLARLDPSDIDQDLLQAMFAQCQIFNKILEFSGVQTHSVKPLKVADVMERLGREQGRLAAVRAMAGVCRTARTRVEAVAGKDDSKCLFKTVFRIKKKEALIFVFFYTVLFFFLYFY